MIANKIIGYVLLFASVGIILFSLWHTFNIFTGKAFPPQIFKNITVNTDSKPTTIEEQVQQSLDNVLPKESINTTLNLTSWMMLMWIFIFGFGKLAGLGIRLVKD